MKLQVQELKYWKKRRKERIALRVNRRERKEEMNSHSINI